QSSFFFFFLAFAAVYLHPSLARRDRQAASELLKPPAVFPRICANYNPVCGPFLLCSSHCLARFQFFFVGQITSSRGIHWKIGRPALSN
ncbi:hypothetical protein B0H66DRAFT_564186, partial [Apodospora peruviana]